MRVQILGLVLLVIASTTYASMVAPVGTPYVIGDTFLEITADGNPYAKVMLRVSAEQIKDFADASAPPSVMWSIEEIYFFPDCTIASKSYSSIEEDRLLMVEPATNRRNFKIEGGDGRYAIRFDLELPTNGGLTGTIPFEGWTFLQSNNNKKHANALTVDETQVLQSYQIKNFGAGASLRKFKIKSVEKMNICNQVTRAVDGPAK